MRDYKEYAVLFVDDEAHALKYFVKAFSNDFTVLTANSAADGLKIIQEGSQEIGVLMTDQRMPGETGVQLLEKTRSSYPQIIRILVTAYADLESAIAAVNSGAIYKYISKPWDINDLQISLMRALDFYAIQKERDQLVKEKMLVVQQILAGSQEKDLAILGMGLSPFLNQAMCAISRFIELIPYEYCVDSPKDSYWKDVEKRTNSEIQNLAYVASLIKSTVNAQIDALEEATELTSILRLDQIAGQLADPSRLTLDVNSNLPRVRVVPRQITTLVTLISKSLQEVASENARISLSVVPCENPAKSNMVEFLFSDDEGNWTTEHWRQIFSPFLLNANSSRKHGLDLLICLIIVMQHNGEFEIPGNENTKIAVRIPYDPLASQEPAGETAEQTFRRLLKNERHWECY